MAKQVPPVDVAWVQRLLDSHAYWLNQELIDRSGDIEAQSERLFLAPFVVASHMDSADPILNYGNRQALDLWETTWEAFTATPSRLTAEPGLREDRARMLQRVTARGFVDDYQGVRISRTGQRFRVQHATVWNVVDENRNRLGQAVAFSDWTPLAPFRKKTDQRIVTSSSELVG